MYGTVRYIRDGTVLYCTVHSYAREAWEQVQVHLDVKRCRGMAAAVTIISREMRLGATCNNKELAVLSQ